MKDNLKEFSNYLVSEYIVSNPLKLQKILFFVRYEEIKNNKSLKGSIVFKQNNNFEAWINGPVIPEVYRSFKHYFYKLDETDNYINSDEVNEKFKIYDKYIEKYIRKTTTELKNMSHKNEAWKLARGDIDSNKPSNNKIDEKWILNEK